MWKEALVTAIPKKGPSLLVSDYRPISITPPSGKVLEKVMKDKLCDWMLDNHIFPAEEHVFLTVGSTTSLLSDALFDWVTALNQGKSIDVVFFDLSKAFDNLFRFLLLL